MKRLFNEEIYERLNNHGHLDEDLPSIEDAIETVNRAILHIYEDEELQNSILAFGKNIDFAHVSRENQLLTTGYEHLRLKGKLDGGLSAIFSEKVGENGGREYKTIAVMVNEQNIAVYEVEEEGQPYPTTKINCLAESMVLQNRRIIEKREKNIESVVMTAEYVLNSLEQSISNQLNCPNITRILR